MSQHIIFTNTQSVTLKQLPTFQPDNADISCPVYMWRLDIVDLDDHRIEMVITNSGTAPEVTFAPLDEDPS